MIENHSNGYIFTENKIPIDITNGYICDDNHNVERKTKCKWILQN